MFLSKSCCTSKRNIPHNGFTLGFTLAEIIITLGIIGVVAAMTMPTLLASINKRQTETKLRKAVSLINQAYKMSYNDNGDLSANEAYSLGAEEYFRMYWQPYIKADICTTPQQCGYDTERPWSMLKGGVWIVNVTYNKNRVTFLTPDGILYSIWTSGGDGKDVYNRVIVDINGAKLPNVLGKDVFWLERNQNDGGVEIIPYCNSATNEYINSKCSINGDGACCAEKVRRAGWKFDSSYPW